MKKLIFTLPFLFCLAGFLQQLNPFLQNSNLIFSWDRAILFQIIYLTIFLVLASLFFVISSTLAQDWRLITPPLVISTLLIIVLTDPPVNLFLAPALLLVFGTIYFLLSKKLSAYINFQAADLLVPSVTQTITLILLVSSIAFYTSSHIEIQQKGFTIPSSLIDSSLKFIPALQLPQTESGITQPNISPEQIELLKQNPDLLKQYGLDPKTLDQIDTTQPQQNTMDMVKPIVEEQLQNLIKPYIQFVPAVLAVAFFFTFKSLASLISILLPGTVWLIFYILEKTGFTKYVSEMREVKKLTV